MPKQTRVTQWHGGKGSDPRRVDSQKFSENWDKIFKKRNVQPNKNDV